MTHSTLRITKVAGLTWDKVKQRLADGAAAHPADRRRREAARAAYADGHRPALRRSISRASLAERIDALIWPTLTYGAYPAFVAYAGSVSLSNRPSKLW